MELKQFIKQILKDVVSAVAESENELVPTVYLASLPDQRTVEFDVAVMVDDATSSSGKAGVKVFSLIEGGGEVTREIKNSSVSRIRFGVSVRADSQHRQTIQTSALRRWPEKF